MCKRRQVSPEWLDDLRPWRSHSRREGGKLLELEGPFLWGETMCERRSGKTRLVPRQVTCLSQFLKVTWVSWRKNSSWTLGLGCPLSQSSSTLWCSYYLITISAWQMRRPEKRYDVCRGLTLPEHFLWRKSCGLRSILGNWLRLQVRPALRNNRWERQHVP